MSLEQNLQYTKEHEWVKYDEKTQIATIGITDYAQQSLGDVVFVELPKIGTKTTANQVIGSVESVKTVSDIYAPLSGEVVEINTSLDSKPELINTAVYEAGWMCKIKIANTNELVGLLSYEAYQKSIL